MKFLTTCKDDDQLLKAGYSKHHLKDLSEMVVLIGVEDCDVEAVVPEGVQVIGFGAFKGCRQLEKVVLPDSCLEVHEDAFADCFGLKIISYKEGIDIDDAAFTNTLPMEIINKIDFQMRKADGTVESIPAKKVF